MRRREKIFESRYFDRGWDGNWGGKPLPQDVYVYSIIAVTNKGREVKKTGNVLLIR